MGFLRRLPGGLRHLQKGPSTRLSFRRPRGAIPERSLRMKGWDETARRGHGSRSGSHEGEREFFRKPGLSVPAGPAGRCLLALQAPPEFLQPRGFKEAALFHDVVNGIREQGRSRGRRWKWRQPFVGGQAEFGNELTGQSSSLNLVFSSSVISRYRAPSGTSLGTEIPNSLSSIYFRDFSSSVGKLRGRIQKSPSSDSRIRF